MPWPRRVWVVVHRWAGLSISVVLIVVGITGALLPFNQELNDWTAPWRLVSPPGAGASLLDPLTLNERARRAAPPGYTTEGLRLHVQPNHVLEIGLFPPAGSKLPFLEAAIDPYTAQVVRISRPGAISEGWDQVMPFLYALHYQLAMGEFGLWMFGIAALVWTFDCFVGFYLTLPVKPGGWWSRWRKAWTVRTPPRNRYKLNVDLHRAGGLWLWPLLLVFAWSGVGMNLPQIYDPVMTFFGAVRPEGTLPERSMETTFKPDWEFAYRHGRELAKDGGVAVKQEYSLFFDSRKGVYSYNVHTNRDFTDKGGWSSILFYPDGTPAKTIIADGALGHGGADRWLMALHTAQVGGLWYRMLVSLVGIVVVVLSVTGIVIWMCKRVARIAMGR